MVVEIRVSRDNEYTPESAEGLFAGFTKNLALPPAFFQKLFNKKPVPGTSLSLEIACWGQQIRFFVHFDDELASFFESQLLGTYSQALVTKTQDYLGGLKEQIFPACQLNQTNTYYYPFKTYKEFKDVDPLANFLAVMSKGQGQDFFVFQMIISRAPNNWQNIGQKAIDTGIPIDKEGHKRPLPGENLIKQKISELGLSTSLRLASNTEENLNGLVGSFAGYTRGDGNSLVASRPSSFAKKKFCQAIIERSPKFTSRNQILSISELATLWHLPGHTIQIPNIAWGKTILSEPPENLPAAINLSEEQKNEICFIASTEFKNRQVNFGIKTDDRRRHIYIIGKTGTGKSTFIANMAVDDIKKGRGVAVVDPHGDLCEILLDYIPSHRINDVCYFNPADRENPVSLNILEVIEPIDAELVTSGIVAIFHKLYGHSWGPRLEHILRSVVITLANVKGTTLVDVLRIMTDKSFRNKTLKKINDPILLSFWHNEFEKMPDRLQKEAISPIQNKVGQFVTSPMIRNIIGRPKSSITLNQVMDEGKILLVNLSQGRLGEDNSALLGAMIITKIQQAAMHRVRIPEEQRRDFYLYVDEFQNFATSSFMKILSEARKYRLNLILANQYMAQIDQEVQKAIFGNAGTMISFVVGAEDAAILEKEYGEVFTQNDLVSLDRFQIAIKLTIDKQTSRPFLAQSLPPAASKNQNREKVIRVSRERFTYRKKPDPKPKPAASAPSAIPAHPAPTPAPPAISPSTFVPLAQPAPIQQPQPAVFPVQPAAPALTGTSPSDPLAQSRPPANPANQSPPQTQTPTQPQSISPHPANSTVQPISPDQPTLSPSSETNSQTRPPKPIPAQSSSPTTQ
ncbi:MAG: type IV secretion system DNA-binding domain-containing protein [Candidatus Pacebacteria bacterium]|nr:type IV secretion system DNA-binding domain-containing protein [Candidatus Paceibacterota bacterium]